MQHEAAESDEPLLKYERLEFSPEREDISSLAVSPNFLCLGTHSGTIFTVDLQGKLVKKWKPHSASILCLSLELSGDFIASASIDGKIIIRCLSNHQENATFDMQRPMRSVALDPDYAKRNSNRQFCSGGMAGTLTLHEKSWLGSKDTALHSGEGPIWSISWQSTLVIWCNDENVRLYDVKSSQHIGCVPRLENSPRVDLYRCTFAWQDDRSVLVAQAEHITVVKIVEKEKPRSMVGVGVTIQLGIKVAAIFQMDCLLSGVAVIPATESAKSTILTLAYPTSDDSDSTTLQTRKEGARPEIRLLSTEGEELSSDEIALSNYARYQVNDYSLAKHPFESTYYIASPKDVIVARLRDKFDHIDWLIGQHDYQRALRAIEKLPSSDRIGRFDVKQLGLDHLQQLFEAERYAEMASIMPDILARDHEAWQDWLARFIDAGKLESVISLVPTQDPILNQATYDRVLVYFLENSPARLWELIKAWPIDIYDRESLIIAVEGAAETTRDSKALQNCLADLHVLNKEPAKALPYYLQLDRPSTFKLISDYNLFSHVIDSAWQLIQLEEKVFSHSQENNSIAIQLLINHTHSIPSSSVVQQLREHRESLYRYLDALFDRDAMLVSDYSADLVGLYADFRPEKLMHFLKLGVADPERAFEICQARDLVPEMVFLLGRMGDNKKALRLLIERTEDVHRAIAFARDQKDAELWEDLVQYAESRPAFIRGLLETTGLQGEPAKLIRRIRNGLQISGLQHALVKILQDSALQISLTQGCESILISDSQRLSSNLAKNQSRAYLGNSERRCLICGRSLFADDGLSTDPVSLVFLCRHAFHAACAFASLEDELPSRPTDTLPFQEFSTKDSAQSMIDRQLSSRLRYKVNLRSQVRRPSCPICGKKANG